MNGITHEQASQYIHMGLPFLDEKQKEALRTHLSQCMDCQEYANLQRLLAEGISQAMHNRWDGQLAYAGKPGNLPLRVRRNTITKNIFRFAYVGVLLAILILGLNAVFHQVIPPVSQPGAPSQGIENNPADLPVQLDPAVCNENAVLAPEGVNLPYPATRVIGGGIIQQDNLTFQIYLYCDETLRPDDPQHFSEIAGLGIAASWAYNGPEQEGQFQVLYGIEPAVTLKTELAGLKKGDEGGYNGGLSFSDRSSSAWQVSELAKSGRPIQFTILVGTEEKMDGASLFFTLQEGAEGYLPVDIAITGKADPFQKFRSILFLSPDGHLYLTDISGSSYDLIAENQNSENAWMAFTIYRPPAVSPDGLWLVLNDGRGYWSLVDLKNNNISAEGHGQAMLSPSWSPDSLSFAYLGLDNRLCLYWLSDETDSCVFKAEENLIGELWSPDGNNIALIIGECCEAQVWLVDTQTWNGVYIASVSITFQSAVKDEISWLQSANSQEPRLLIKAQNNFSNAVVYSPDTREFQALDRPILELSKDGNVALYPSGEIGIVNGDVIFTPYDGDEVLVNDWSISPDGEKIAYLTSRKDALEGQALLAVISLPQGKLLWQLDLPERMQRIEWDPSGQYFILDRADLNPGDSPIWKLSTNVQGKAEVFIDQGFLIGVIP